MFIAFSGISGSGKNTIMNELMKVRPNLKVLEYATGTTRAPRESDKDNNTYVFLSKEEFEKGVAEGKFCEYENYCGNYYGTFVERLESVVDSEFDFMKDIDVNGNANLKKFYAGRCKMLSIFIDVPDELLRQRLVKRGESEESIAKRLSRGEYERSRKDEYDLVIENIDLQKAVEAINNFIEANKTTN
ncbi:MAG: guanylate kinase [Clostridia bacterium]|nr:guanylate kinase [Clostridia bacterium]